MAERINPFEEPEEPRERQYPLDPADAEAMMFMGFTPEVAASYALDAWVSSFTAAWREGVAADRREKGLPEQRRSPLKWAGDQVTVWRAKKNLKKINTPNEL